MPRHLFAETLCSNYPDVLLRVFIKFKADINTHLEFERKYGISHTYIATYILKLILSYTSFFYNLYCHCSPPKAFLNVVFNTMVAMKKLFFVYLVCVCIYVCEWPP